MLSEKAKKTLWKKLLYSFQSWVVFHVLSLSFFQRFAKNIWLFLSIPNKVLSSSIGILIIGSIFHFIASFGLIYVQV